MVLLVILCIIIILIIIIVILIIILILLKIIGDESIFFNLSSPLFYYCKKKNQHSCRYHYCTPHPIGIGCSFLESCLNYNSMYLYINSATFMYASLVTLSLFWILRLNVNIGYRIYYMYYYREYPTRTPFNFF